MQSTTRFGRSENGGVLFKATLVLCSDVATRQRFMFVREMLGRSACRPSASIHGKGRLLRRIRKGTSRRATCTLFGIEPFLPKTRAQPFAPLHRMLAKASCDRVMLPITSLKS